MLVQKMDAQGNPMVGADGKPILIEIPDEYMSKSEAEKLAKEVGKQAKEKLEEAHAKAEKERVAREKLEAELERRDKAKKEAELAALPPDAQMTARLKELEHGIERERGARLQSEESYKQHLRVMGLATYRERAVRDVPDEVRDLVNGQSEEEIDQAVDIARETHAKIEARIRGEYEQRMAQGAAMAGYGVPMPPPNPAYVPPPPSMAQGGFPQVTNPLPVAEMDQGQVMSGIGELTTEEAVRGGRYGGEMRERIHAQLKGQTRYPGQLGSAPRHWSGQHQVPQQHVQMPGGVMQPQGSPMGPVQHPGMPYPQQQQYAQPMPQQPYYPPQPQQQFYGQPQQQPYGQPAMDPARAAAQAAVERTRAGQNPVLGQNLAAGEMREAVHASRQYGQRNGVTPQGAFDSRFTHTPPLSPHGAS